MRRCAESMGDIMDQEFEIKEAENRETGENGDNGGGQERRRRRVRKKSLLDRIPYSVLIGTLAVLLVIAGVLAFRRSHPSGEGENPEVQLAESEEMPPETETLPPETEDESLTGFLERADRLAVQYDYDGAIAYLQESPWAEDAAVTEKIAEYEGIKATLVRQDPSKITHVFFHTLVMDNAKAFDGDRREAGYNQVMTTKSEFEKILQSMYDRGFVLVRLHDIAYETTGEDGVPRFVQGDIMLPEGKQAFVMSQDDVCYYEYMDGDGFATKMIIGEDGRPTNEMKMDDGSVQVGSFDLVPLLDDFIDEHPDFSYRGAKACIAFTGYNGILGYRTDLSYETNEDFKAAHPGFDIEEERRQAIAVCQALRDDGFEIASHSWGHRNMGTISMDDFRADTSKWEERVEVLTGPCDIILFPFGSDIGDWHPYDTSSERFQVLYQAGFRYFCNVDSNQYFVQIGDDYMRQGRRNLDGYRMYYDLPESNPTKTHLDDLMDGEEVFDRSRPVPVPPMG